MRRLDMTGKNIFIVVIMISMIISSVVLSGCTEAPEEKQTVTIGGILPLTGDLGVYGQNVKAGAELAVDEINAAGGIDGKKIIFTCEDNRGEATDTVSSFRKLVDVDNVPVIVGAVVSTNTLAIAPLAQEDKVVLISISTSPKLSQWEDGYFFRVIASDSYQGRVMAQLARDMNYSKIGVMYINNEYGVGLMDVFVEKFEELGGTVLIKVPHDEGKTDFRSEITNLKASQPPAVMMVSYVKEASIIFKQARELGLETQWFCSETHKSDEFVGLVGDAAEGILITYPSTDPKYSDFKADYNAKYHQDPGIYAAEGYDMVKAIAMGMEQAGSTTNATAIKTAMRQIDYSGPSGHKVFDEFGDVPGAYDVWTVTNGTFERYEVS
jgi:branched-chain amino acid transport system substrate-binding protein